MSSPTNKVTALTGATGTVLAFVFGYFVRDPGAPSAPPASGQLTSQAR